MKTHAQLYKEWLARPMSWSQIGSWRWNVAQWYDGYFLQNRGAATENMLAGSAIGASFATDHPMAPVPRCDIYEYPLHFKVGNIKCIGFIDGLSKDKHQLTEFKTCARDGKWNQGSVDSHDQITMYLLGLMLQDHIQPQNVKARLIDIRVEERGDFTIAVTNPPRIYTYYTKRNLHDVLAFAAEIRRTHKNMLAEIKERQERK